MHRAHSGPFRVRIEARQRGSSGSISAVSEEMLLALIRNEAEQERFCFVPISSLKCRRALSRVKMNVFRTPLTALAAKVKFQPSTAATSALTFMTFS